MNCPPKTEARKNSRKKYMYNIFADQVKTFDKVFNCHLPSKEKIEEDMINILHVLPENITEEGKKYLENLHRRAMFGARLGLIVEEAGEWAESFLKEKPQTEQDKELADLAYVVIGAGDVLGSKDFDTPGGGMDTVMKKNQIKLDNPEKMRIGNNGKIIKPEDQ